MTLPLRERLAASGRAKRSIRKNWDEIRAQGHRMLDDMIDYVAKIRERPVWRPIPDEVRARFRAELPRQASDLGEVYREFADFIAPYATGNVHPGFMGWVHGGGTAVGMLAEMLAAGLNANLGGRDHIPIEVERQIVEWTRAMFGFPVGASGIFVTGTSMANLMAVLVARTAALGQTVRQHGVGGEGALLTAYTSTAAHGCVAKAMDLAGFGSDALRSIGGRSIASCRRRGDARPDRLRSRGRPEAFSRGRLGRTVDIGAIDDLAGAERAVPRGEALVSRRRRLWRARGSFAGAGAAARRDCENADSIALDFHKWGQVPYDAGFLIVRDGERHREAFSAPAAYLRRETRGLAAGSPWPCDLGPDLSRGFRALKTWFTLKTYGTEKLGAMIERTCALAGYLQARILAEPRLELLAPVQLNIVCFRYRAADADSNTLNGEIVFDIQESGISAPSTTMLDGRLAIRAAIVNHRTDIVDIDALVAAVLEFGARRSSGGLAPGEPSPPLTM